MRLVTSAILQGEVEAVASNPIVLSYTIEMDQRSGRLIVERSDIPQEVLRSCIQAWRPEWDGLEGTIELLRWVEEYLNQVDSDLTDRYKEEAEEDIDASVCV